VADARRVKPLDGELLNRLRGRPIVTVEENAVKGGFGSAVLEYFEEEGVLDEVRVRSLGFPDAFMDHATRDEQLAELSLDADGIARTVREFLHQQARVGK
jgi:1-deoxy-D-xylulose-5-phosphate synthase